MGVTSIEMRDPPYDEIPADQVDNLYDEIHPRSCREESTVTEDTQTSGGTQNGVLGMYVCVRKRTLRYFRYMYNLTTLRISLIIYM